MNWGDLKAAVAAYSLRGDAAPVIGTLLAMAEDRIYNGMQAGRTVPGLRLQSMLTTVQPFVAGALPAGLLAIERVSVQRSSRWIPLEYRSSDQLSALEGNAGTAGAYTVRGGALVVGPEFTEEMQLLYYARPATPSADTDENAVMAAAPSVYLYSLLVEVGHWLRDAEIVAQYTAALAAAMTAASNADESARRGNVPLRIVSSHSVRV